MHSQPQSPIRSSCVVALFCLLLLLQLFLTTANSVGSNNSSIRNISNRNNNNNNHNENQNENPSEEENKNNNQQQEPPNIIVILTDDLDLELGGLDASTLVKTRELLAKQGMIMNNWFAQTPVCCPSRAEMLTGRYFHNLWVPDGENTTKSNCMHIDVTSNSKAKFYNDYYFAKYFQRIYNYTIGLFGKHLNGENPTNFIPDGVDIMLINNGGQYLNPTFTWATRPQKKNHNNDDIDNHDIRASPKQVQFNNCTNFDCYTTSIVGNASIAWIKRHIEIENNNNNNNNNNNDITTGGEVRTKKRQPFFSLISVKAPHLQDGPGFPTVTVAPWYVNTTIIEKTAPRTLNYNMSCPNHHWLVRNQQPITKQQESHIDELYLSRLKSLLSVDDLVEELVTTLDNLQVLQNTYIIFTSDNGYHLGQYNLPSCKLHVYENDIRLPMLIRGPGIIPSLTTRNDIIGTHVDLMPTLLGLVHETVSSSPAAGTTTTTTTTTTTKQEKTTTTTTKPTKDVDSVDVVPPTMDGRNLASQIIQPNPTYPSKRFLLIEYKSLGNVVRYEHLVDTFNHSFVALRIIDESVDFKYQNLKYVQYRDSRIDWNSTHKALEAELFDLNSDPYEIINLLSGISSSNTGGNYYNLNYNYNENDDDDDDDQRRRQRRRRSRSMASPIFVHGLSTIISHLIQCQGKVCRDLEDDLGRYYTDLVHKNEERVVVEEEDTASMLLAV